MPSKKFIWDPQHWRFRARTVADQMTHEEAKTIMRRHHVGSGRSLTLCSLDDDQPRAGTVPLSGPLG